MPSPSASPSELRPSPDCTSTAGGSRASRGGSKWWWAVVATILYNGRPLQPCKEHFRHRRSRWTSFPLTCGGRRSAGRQLRGVRRHAIGLAAVPQNPVVPTAQKLGVGRRDRCACCAVPGHVDSAEATRAHMQRQAAIRLQNKEVSRWRRLAALLLCLRAGALAQAQCSFHRCHRQCGQGEGHLNAAPSQQWCGSSGTGRREA